MKHRENLQLFSYPCSGSLANKGDHPRSTFLYKSEQQNKGSLPLLLYNQHVINENQQKCEARGKEMVSFFFPSSCHPLRWFWGRFQHINCLIILNYKKIIRIFYYRQAEKPKE